MAKKRIAHKKVGKPPGYLVYTGDRPDEKISFHLTELKNGELIENDSISINEIEKHDFGKSFSWLNVKGLADIDNVAKIGKIFNIHPLTIEDIISVYSRPKFEEYDDYIFIVLKMLYYNGEELVSEHVSFILKENCIITFQELEQDVFEGVRFRLREGKGRIRTAGVDYLMYALIDALVDHYFIVFETFGDKIENLEDKILDNPDDSNSIQIQNLKREVYRIRKAVFPLREAISRYERSEHKFLKEDTKPYIRDVHDHSIQIIETVENYRDSTMSLMDLYMSSISNKMNNVMKVLTVISTIFIPLTFLAGIYGMNFDNIPELHYENAYFILWGVMLTLFVIMLIYFKKKKWF